MMTLKKMFDRYIFTRGKDDAVILGRARVCDNAAAFTFRMGAGFPGAVNRSHPCNIEPALIDTTSGAPPTFYGQAVVADAAAPNGVRVPKTGDTAALIYGVTVRPFPTQQASATSLNAAYGNIAPPNPAQPIDILKSGYIIVTLQGAAPTFKGTPVNVCTIAGTGYVAGGFSADTVSGTFVTLDSKSYFNGPEDASNIVELAFNL
jgi:hypothetical protein